MDKNIKLIDGVFSAEDAREVIGSLLQFKITFHEKKNFSNEIRTGTGDHHSVLRIQELKTMQLDFDKFLHGVDPVAEFEVFAEITLHKK
ncbi:MAG: hypothetical protein CFE23_07890 [Flavobacterium sp. BFFFF1]|uniref:hypothetical protein n=1 Tax=unclassified Flavobacterium TaxID=196869 RepID=UPI000BDCFEB5|nr:MULTISPECIES: hypothetical protein [unclassified Flavobacterium]OYU80637.1 MAG: hypothetical protein CFE23_07890 [Flavobacterium sp. BFFFF1]